MQDLGVDDLFSHAKILALSGHPQHSTLAMTRSQARQASDDYASTLWITDVRQASPPQSITPADFPVASACISPDGRSIAFLSRRGDDPREQVYLLPLAGGEAQRLDTGALQIEALLQWSADCRQLLASVRVPFAEDELDDPQAKDRPIVTSHLPYKQDGKGPITGARTHLYRLSLDGSEPVQLTCGDFDVAGGAWSPDGRWLAYCRTGQRAQRHVSVLWLAEADGGQARCVTPEFALVSGAAWSPDSRHIAFAGSRIAGDSLSQPYVLQVDAGAPRQLGDSQMHLEGATLQWHPGGRQLATICNHRGLFEIAVLTLEDGGCRRIHRGLKQVSTLTVSDDGIAFVSASMCWPDEASFIRWDGTGERRLTGWNRQWMRQRHRPRCSLRRFEVPDGSGGTERVDAWLLRPPQDRPPPWPVLIDMHGGPQSVALMDFASHLYWYELAAQGWLIVAPNTVGSGGYGDEFAKRLQSRWGELDFPQQLAILDRLQADGLADERVACAGKSYGGFLSAWAVGQSERFRAAVVSAPVANVESHAGTSDSGFYVTPYAMGGEIDDIPERYRALSPVNYFGQVHAPTLLLCGQDDERCPVGQVEELMARLVRSADCACQMVLYPGGSHQLAGSGRPSHRRDYHRRIVHWVCKHVDKPAAASAGP